MKRRLSSGSPSLTFFAFQDIITAVTGIMVLIALLMSLQLTQPKTTTSKIDPALAQKQADLSAERDRLNQQVRGLVATAKNVPVGASDTAAQIENLNNLVRTLNTESARLVQEASTMSAAGAVEVDIDELRRANGVGRAKLAAAQKDNAAIKRAIDGLEGKVEAAQQAVLETTRNQSDIWLIPERSDTSKEPVIISVLPDAFVSQGLDAGSEKRVNRTGDPAKDLKVLLESCKPVDQYLVFYFRPSSLESFDAVKEAAKALGYEIGYDLVDDGAVVKFTTQAGDIVVPEPAATPAPKEPADSEAESSSAPVDIAAEVEKRGTPLGNGSGFFITSNGYFVTNEHVAAVGGTYFVGSKEFGWLRARLVGKDSDRDLALLKVEGGTVAMPVAHSDKVKLGETVATIGFPNIELQGLSPKFNKGEISSLSGLQDDPNNFQISVPVQPGNSGGLLFNEEGSAVGIVSARLSQEAALAVSGTHAESVNYAIKSGVLLDWLRSLAAPDCEPLPAGEKCASFQDAVSRAEKSIAMILVYP